MLQGYKDSLDTFVGPTGTYVAGDTLQVHDYSRCEWTMFDPEHKKKLHEEAFPEHLKNVFALGGELADRS